MTVVLGPVLQMVCGGGGYVFRVECRSFDDLVRVKKQCCCLLLNSGVEVKVERSGVFEE